MRHTSKIENPIKDFTYAGRTLRKSPIFATTAAVTLALGIGASTAIFSVTNAVLLRPLPYPSPDRLVLVFWENRPGNSRNFLYSNADFFDLRAGAGRFSTTSAASPPSVRSYPAKMVVRNRSARRWSPPTSSG
jgi:hypothetical protein